MYQEEAMNRVFVKDRARSGIIVLPCGAGKTLVGISAICQMKKRTLVLCINNLNVKQWCRQIELFTNINPKQIFKFISVEKDDKNLKVPDLNQPCIVVSTYTMISKNDEFRYINKIVPLC